MDAHSMRWAMLDVVYRYLTSFFFTLFLIVVQVMEDEDVSETCLPLEYICDLDSAKEAYFSEIWKTENWKSFFII